MRLDFDSDLLLMNYKNTKTGFNHSVLHDVGRYKIFSETGIT